MQLYIARPQTLGGRRDDIKISYTGSTVYHQLSFEKVSELYTYYYKLFLGLIETKT